MNHSKLVTEDFSDWEIQTATGSTFNELVLEADGPIAVEFMSYSCEYCRALEPVIEKVAQMVKPKEKIFKVNIANDQGLAERFGIQATPTLLMFLNGQRVGQIAGPRPTVSSVLTAVSQPFRSMI